MESMNKQCVNCHKTFTVSAADLEFYDRVSPVFAGKKYLIPAPTHCPDCRLQRRLAIRNEKCLYNRTCDLCGKKIISQFPAKTKYKIYCQECWWSDKWMPEQYAKDFNFQENFFQQYARLLAAVPKANLVNKEPTLDNSDYVNFMTDAKNCYLVFAANFLENCMYSSYIWESKDTLDCSYSTKLELCYDCMDCDNLFKCQFLQQSRNCHECMIGYGLKNCANCFGCINLNIKKNYFFNKPLSSEQYQQKIQEILRDENKFNKAKEQFADFSLKYPRKFAHQINCENSSGEGIKNCKNCQHCFDGYDGEDLKWLMNFPGKTKDCYDVSGCAEIELAYESHCCGLPGYRVLFANMNITGAQNLAYCTNCDNCKDCFGCVGIKKVQYAIFNKEYSKKEYEKLAGKIIQHMQKTGEWGEFFPISISPFAYNETVAYEYFPLKKEEVLARGWKWKDAGETSTSRFHPICSKCGRNFNIIPQEKLFYAKQNIFLPKKCPDCRNQERISLRNTRSLWKRQCMCTQPDHNHHGRCANEFETTYSPERKELVYCEDCYQKEVY